MNAKVYVENVIAEGAVEPRGALDAQSEQGRIDKLKALFEEFAREDYKKFSAIYLEHVCEDFRDYFYNVKDKDLERLFESLDEETLEEWRDELYEKLDSTRESSSEQGLIEEIKQKYTNAKIYIVVESRLTDINENAILVETDDDILIFDDSSGLYDEPFCGSWTDDINEFEMDSDISLFVKEVR